MSKNVRRKEERPGEIVDAAIEIFAKKGYAKTTFGAIAESLNMSRSNIYLYFPDKASLFQTCVKTVVLKNMQLLSKDVFKEDLPLDKTLHLITDVLTTVFSDKILVEFIIMALSESKFFPELAKIWHEEVVYLAAGLFEKILGPKVKVDLKFLWLQVVSPIFMTALSRHCFGEQSPFPTLSVLKEKLPEIILDNVKHLALE